MITDLTDSNIDTSRVLGLDVSTKSIAFAVIENGNLKRYGKVYIEGDGIWERAADANRKTYSILKLTKPTHVSIEGAVYVNNRSVVIKLSYIYGAIAGVVGATGHTMSEVSPIAWMSFIGSPANTKQKKDALKSEYPEKSKSWLQTESRRRRKQYTIDWAKSQFSVDIDDDDAADAVGVAWYAWNNDAEISH